MLQRIACLALLAALATGCERFERTRQCRALAELVNPELEAIEKVQQSGKHDAKTFEDISNRYRQLSERMKAFEAKESLVSTIVTQYVELLKETATVTRSLSDALREKDVIRARHEELELERIARQQRVLSSQLGGACSAS